MLRARREQPAEIDEVPTAGLSEQVQQRADLQELLRDLHDLPREQREALVLFEIGDLSQAEVADVIGVEPMKVKALVFQARSALIENREARAIPCAEIREQLATATGGALRRGPLRRHLKTCDGCREYRDQVRTQRAALAMVLPVVPTMGLKDSVLAAIGLGGGAGGGGAAAGGAVGGGGMFAALGGAGAAKLAVGAALGLAALGGGGVAIERAVDNGDDTAQAAGATETGAGSAAQGGGDRSTGSPALVGKRGRGDDESGDERKSDDGGKSGDEKADDESAGGREGERRSHRGGRKTRTRRHGSGRSHGSRSSGRGGRSGSHRSNGSTGRSSGPRNPAHPANPPRNSGNRGGNSGSGSGSSESHAPATTTTTPETTTPEAGNKGTRVPSPSAAPAPVDDGVEKLSAAVPAPPVAP